HYLTYMDIAFAEYLRRGLAVSQDDMLHTVIARTTLNYRAPAHYDDVLTVWVRVVRIGRTSLTVSFVIARAEETLVEAETVYVYVDEATRRPSEVPVAWRQRIAEYEPAFEAGL
ncbi:MAG: acyl-CoA thioesterase, partial [Alicyclobacillus sp.]|nr:acyl-CoA thioesterase [Alicyclobacillus sp.]